MMAKSFTLDGTRYKLDPKTPTAEIEHIMRRVHVGTSDADVLEHINVRLDNAALRDPAFTDTIKEQCRKFALACHRKNQALYNDVMSGNIGAKRRRK